MKSQQIFKPSGTCMFYIVTTSTDIYILVISNEIVLIPKTMKFYPFKNF